MQKSFCNLFISVATDAAEITENSVIICVTMSRVSSGSIVSDYGLDDMQYANLTME
jgi:hypothetical protein